MEEKLENTDKQNKIVIAPREDDHCLHFHLCCYWIYTTPVLQSWTLLPRFLLAMLLLDMLLLDRHQPRWNKLNLCSHPWSFPED